MRIAKDALPPPVAYPNPKHFTALGIRVITGEIDDACREARREGRTPFEIVLPEYAVSALAASTGGALEQAILPEQVSRYNGLAVDVTSGEGYVRCECGARVLIGGRQ